MRDLTSGLYSVERVNEILREFTEWEVDVGVSPFNQSKFYRVYDRRDGVGERQSIGAIPIQTPPGSIACFAEICGHYYRLGLERGRAEITAEDTAALSPNLADCGLAASLSDSDYPEF